MNKYDLIQKMSARLSLTKKDVESVFNETFTLITEELMKEQSVRIVGFGHFKTRKRHSRFGRNPHTGDRIKLEETLTPCFTPGKGLTDAVKGR